ncbi:MAG: alpha-L-fucosidase [Verrucomicrobiae bacterium]|nr:alpha-L-fucosidase [Verrucomicrobiae bacterium]
MSNKWTTSNGEHGPIYHYLRIILFLTFVRAAIASQTGSGPLPYPEHMRWWGEARFGLFIHWGPVSLMGTEIGWSRAGERRGYGSKGTEVPVEIYDNLFTRFNPTNFNAREWVAIAKQAGMKYLVFTSRHHDGFSMFDTKASDYKITSPRSPFQRDVVRELADACHEANLRFGLYYSQPDWHHPDAFTPDRHHVYLAYLRQQVTELCSNYGQLDILWFDGLGKPASDYDGENLIRIARSLQPHIIINNRTGLPADHDTPEQRIGKYQDNRPWESCITICQQWAWKPNDALKSFEQCIHTLVLCAGGDGNLLLNVGPMPDGRIEPRQVDRLKQIGAWLATYGQTIYATRGGPWKPSTTIASTRRQTSVYLHILHQTNDVISLPDIPKKVKRASLMNGREVETHQSEGKLVISLPPTNRTSPDTIVHLELDGTAMDIPALSTSDVTASASNVYHGMVDEFGPEMAFDNDPSTRWATDSGTKQAWIAVDLGKPFTASRIVIREAMPFHNRVKSFQFQYRDANQWKTIFADTAIGQMYQREFNPVTAREFRLNITDASEGPTISEIQIQH